MATQYMTETCFPQMQLPSGFSIVVDDVDGAREEEFEEPSDEVEEAQEAVEGAPCECGVHHERRGSRGPDPQLCSERIRQIQIEAESRKNEFAKLLEEHAQVVLRVKQMEQRDHLHQHQAVVHQETTSQQVLQPLPPATQQQLISKDPPIRIGHVPKDSV